MGTVVYLPKLKMGLGLSLGAHFLHHFFLFNTLSIDKVSMSSLFFSFSRDKTKYVTKFLFRQLITS